MPDNEYESAEDEAYSKGMEFIQDWDYLLGDIEAKWDLPRGETLDRFCLTFRGH